MAPRTAALRFALALLLGAAAFALTQRVLLDPLRGGTVHSPPAATAPVSPPLEPSGELRSLDIGGRTRTFLLHRPTRTPVGAPLWIVLHGSGGSGEEVQRMHEGAFDRLADRETFVVAYPDGYDEHWNDCRPRADYAANREDVDDVGFLRALIESVHVEDGIDLDQVTFIGMSNGGHMVFRLAFEASELGRTHVALLANLPAPGNDDCRHENAPVRMLLINGSEDPVNPAAGGLVNLAGNTSRGTVLSARATAEEFARLGGYSTPPARRRWPDRAPLDGTSIESSEWSSASHPGVVWIRVVGGGHSVPTTATLRSASPAMQAYLLQTFGRQSHEFETAEIVWRFSSSLGAELL